MYSIWYSIQHFRSQFNLIKYFFSYFFTVVTDRNSGVLLPGGKSCFESFLVVRRWLLLYLLSDDNFSKFVSDATCPFSHPFLLWLYCLQICLTLLVWLAGWRMFWQRLSQGFAVLPDYKQQMKTKMSQVSIWQLHFHQFYVYETYNKLEIDVQVVSYFILKSQFHFLSQHFLLFLPSILCPCPNDFTCITLPI